ncbi:MAG: MATE family efflux transporter [Ruminococcaceae bacterium]|nr:MATE family efflux transporter [Oscillospiraceae bacterium]
MNNKEFWRKLTPLVFPIAFQQLMSALVSTSDTLMMGLIDQASLSAVSLATQITFVLSLFCFGLTGAGSLLAAQYWGKGSKPEVEQVFAVMLRPMAAVGMLFTLAALLCPGLLMRIFTPDPELIRLGSGYLRAVSLSYVLMCINQSYLTILRNSGRAGTATVISSTGVVVNIALNAVLIFGLLGLPALGAVGAALATTLTRVLEFVWVLAETARPDRIKLRKGYLFGRCPLKKDYWKHGVILTANNVIWGVGITMGSVILGRLGSDAVAANSIAMTMKNLVNCFCMGLASGGAILVGNELGADNLETAKKYGGKVVRLALLSGAITAVFLISMTPVILNLAELSDQSREYLRWMIVVCAINLIGMSNNSAIISGIFPAGGDTRFGFICDIITLWVIVVPLGMLGAFVWELPIWVVYIFINMDEWVKIPAVFHHYKKYKWVRNLTKQEDAP